MLAELRLLSSQQLLWGEERQLLFQTPGSVGTRCCGVQSSGLGRWTVGTVAQPRALAERHRNAPLRTDPSPRRHSQPHREHRGEAAAARPREALHTEGARDAAC